MDKICFVISPLGDEGSETRKRSDQVLKHVIKPAAVDCGYEAIRADEISEPGLITSQVIQHIVDDPLVIADLTERNPNVFYELALRHALKKPLVQIIKKGEQIPFDVAGMRTIPVDHHDLDSVEEGRKEISAQIRAVEKKKPNEIESPISVSLELQELRQSDKPEQRTLADVLSTITQLRTSQEALEKKLGSPESILPPQYLRSMIGELIERTGPSVDRMLLEEIDYVSHMLFKSDCIDKKSKLYPELRERLDRIFILLRHSPR